MLSRLTVRETVEIAAALKLPTSVTPERRAARVDNVLGVLGLSHVADSLVGDAAGSGE